jgi:hypothetical protein
MVYNPIPGIFENLVADAIVAALVVGGVITWLKDRGARWLIPSYWGLGGAAMVLVAFSALRVIAIPVPKPVEAITADNLESHVRDWSLSSHLGVRKLPDNPNEYYFAFALTNLYGRTSVVSRLHQPPGDAYLQIQASVTLGQDDMRRLHALSQVDTVTLVRELQIEMARAKMGFEGLGMPLTIVTVKRPLPITGDVTSAAFIQALDDVDLGEVLLLAAIPRYIDELTAHR